MDRFEIHLWHRILRKCSFVLATEAMLVTLLSFCAGFYLSQYDGFALPYVAGLWCAISGIIVLQVTIDESISAGWLRILGSTIGALCAYVFASLLGFTILTLALTVLAAAISTSIFNIKHTLRLACLTGQIIIIVGMSVKDTSPFWNSASRWVESIIGTLIAIAITTLFYPLRKKLQLLNR